MGLNENYYFRFSYICIFVMRILKVFLYMRKNRCIVLK